MSGTKAGGAKAAATNKAKYGEDFYKRLGHRGGSVCGRKGFALNPELAKIAGSIGGHRSKRGKALRDKQGRAITKDGELYARYKTRSFYE